MSLGLQAAITVRLQQDAGGWVTLTGLQAFLQVGREPIERELMEMHLAQVCELHLDGPHIVGARIEPRKAAW